MEVTINMSVTRILVGVDGSPASHRAVEWTAALADRTDASVIAVHAFPVGMWHSFGQPNGTLPVALPGRTETMLDAELKGPWTAALHSLGGRLSTRLEPGHAAHVLVDVAVAEEADLIVVGNRGLGGFGELLLGSVSQNVTQHASTPVAVVRGGDGEVPLGLRTIVVGLDGSPDSMGALDWATELAGRTGAEVILASIVPTDLVLMPERDATDTIDQLKQRLEERASRLRGHTVTCRTEAAVGSPAQELMALARREGAGLVVVGSRGLGGIRARMLGSVSHQLAHHLDRPLLIVRPAAIRVARPQSGAAGSGTRPTGTGSTE